MKSADLLATAMRALHEIEICIEGGERDKTNIEERNEMTEIELKTDTLLSDSSDMGSKLGRLQMSLHCTSTVQWAIISRQRSIFLNTFIDLY